VPSTKQRRSLALLAAGAALTAGLTGGFDAAAAPGSGAKDPSSDAAVTTGLDSTSAIVGLSLAPLATDPKVAPAKGKKIDFNSSAAKSERSKLVAQRNTFKKWLQSNAPKAQVTGEYDVAVNAVAVRLNGTDLGALRNGPGVVSVGYQGTYSPTADDPDLSLIDAKLGWAAATPNAADSTAGAGIKVGIVDTGIDITHPCFAAPRARNAAPFTTDKVIIAKVFANKAANLGYTAEAVQDHGTHVAGTVACNVDTPASIDGVAITGAADGYAPSGVAPGALLGSYNVFPGDITNARSEDILNALDAAAYDGMDVINMSLGGDAHGVQDLLTTAVDNLDRGANIVVAVSAGNSGPGHYTIGSPGSAERALTAGASSVGHLIGIPVYAGDTTSGTPLAVTASGDFGLPETPLSGTLVASGGATLGIGCVDGSYTVPAGPWIALVSRGTCTFGTKVAMAEKAGADGVIVVNNTPGDPSAMAADPLFPTTIPGVMAPLDKRDALVARAASAGHVTIDSTGTYARTGNDDIMGSFSSQGPVDVSYRVKPDLVAPGVNVLSSIPMSFCEAGPANPDGCWAFFNGTSMASPHLAGTAAVVRSAHPSWRAEQVRSAITNTAKQDTLWKSSAITTKETDPMVTGAGLDDVDAAVDATVALSSVSTSFGAVPSGSGKSMTSELTLTDLSGADQTLPVKVTGDPAFGVSASSVTVPANGSATLTVTYDPTKAIDKGDHSATLDLGVAHSVLYAFAK
jgi:minor extracellular serine protease Vpr